MRNAAQLRRSNLDGKQLGAMDGILSRVLVDETVAIVARHLPRPWIRGAMLRREATPEEMESLQRNPTLRLLLSVEE